MSRKKSRRQAKSTGTAVALTLKAIAAAVSAITLATVAYYKWASQIAGSKRKVAAYLAPVGLIGVVSIIGLAAPQNQSLSQRHIRHTNTIMILRLLMSLRLSQ